MYKSLFNAKIEIKKTRIVWKCTRQLEFTTEYNDATYWSSQETVEIPMVAKFRRMRRSKMAAFLMQIRSLRCNSRCRKLHFLLLCNLLVHSKGPVGKHRRVLNERKKYFKPIIEIFIVTRCRYYCIIMIITVKIVPQKVS